MNEQRGKIGGRISGSAGLAGKVGNSNGIAGEVGKAQTQSVRELSFGTRFEFPTIGEPQLLYIATDENQSYRWDAESKRYVCVGADWHDIEIIDGGDSNG